MSEDFYPGYSQGSSRDQSQLPHLGRGKGLGPLRQTNREGQPVPKGERRRVFDMVGKVSFWEVVRECLTDLFSVPLTDAQSLSLDRRATVDLAPVGLRSNIYYQREPFDVARDLFEGHPDRPPGTVAGLDDPVIKAAYEPILLRHGFL